MQLVAAAVTQQATKTVIAVGLGELKYSKDPKSCLTSFSLGSCIGLTMYDRATGFGVMAHIVLPRSNGRTDGPPARYADTAVTNMLKCLASIGIRPGRVSVKMAGGARILSLGAHPGMDIGSQNTMATLESLGACGLAPEARDTGGNYGRTVRLSLADGTMSVLSVGRPTATY